MDDPESAVENEATAEDEVEYEDPTDFQNQIKILATSAARQAYCYFSVLAMPLFSPIFLLVYVHYPEQPTLTAEENVHLHVVRKMMITISGIVFGGILLRLLGRKSTVIAVNLSEFLIFLYAYATGITEWAPYLLSVTHNFVDGVGATTFFIYLTEMTSPTFRAFFLTSYSMLSMLLTFQYREIVWAHAVNTLFRNCTIIAALLLSLSFFTPDTPFWSTMKGNPEKAEETFKWLRAGPSDMAEYEQMVARAENIIGSRFWKPFLTPTFLVCLIFSVFMIVGAFDHCRLMMMVTHTYYSPRRFLLHAEHKAMRSIIWEHQRHEIIHAFYGHLIFLLFQFVVPRKVLYFASYAIGLLLIAPLRFRIGSTEMLKTFASFCNLTPLIGITQLNQILPAEIYPIAVREIGLVFTASLANVYNYLDWHALESPAWWFSPLNNSHVDKTLIYFRFYVSLIGIPFILILMPETKNTNAYELNELNLNVLSLLRRPAGEGASPAAEEGASPAAEEGTSPAAEEGESPAAEEGASPAADEGESSAAEDETTAEPETSE